LKNGETAEAKTWPVCGEGEDEMNNIDNFKVNELELIESTLLPPQRRAGARHYLS
jgi:hypothetical protein